MKMTIGLTFVTILVTSCAMAGGPDQHDPTIRFSNVVSDYRVTDENSYGCDEIDSSIIEHILSTGEWVSEKKLHDHYSTTGCSVRGTVILNGAATGFLFDYGGIIYLDNGKFIACGEKCCTDEYPYCSYDTNELNV